MHHRESLLVRYQLWFERSFAYVMMMPSTLFILAFVGFPFLLLLTMSVTTGVFSVVQPIRWVGLLHYKRALANTALWNYLGNTVIYVIGSIWVGAILHFLIAWALNNLNPKFERFWLTFILLPWAIPYVISAMFWKWMLQGDVGIIPWVLRGLGLISEEWQYMSGKWSAMAVIIVTHMWTWGPIAITLMNAGFKGIPQQMYEAAQVDGANPWQQFRYITFPFMKPSILVSVVMLSMFTMRQMGEILTLTEGGPGKATTVLAIHIYRNLVLYGRPEYASVVGILLMIATVVLVWIIHKLIAPRYELD